MNIALHLCHALRHAEPCVLCAVAVACTLPCAVGLCYYLVMEIPLPLPPSDVARDPQPLLLLCLPPPQGVSTHIKLKAAGELQDSGKREVYFEANGVPRVVEVTDKKSKEVLGTTIREKVRVR